MIRPRPFAYTHYKADKTSTHTPVGLSVLLFLRDTLAINPKINIVDGGIGSYEYFGAQGYDSFAVMECDEVYFIDNEEHVKIARDIFAHIEGIHKQIAVDVLLLSQGDCDFADEVETPYTFDIEFVDDERPYIAVGGQS